MQKTNIFLGLVAVLLLLLILVINQEPAQQQSPSLVSPQLNEYSTVQIQTRGETPVTLTKRAGVWFIEGLAGGKLVASQWKLQQLLKHIAVNDYERVAGVKELDEFGLVQPIVVLKLDSNEIAFGNTNPLSRKRYILMNSKVYLIKDDIYRHVIADWVEFVDKTLIPEDKKITGIEVSGNQLVHSKPGGWVFSPPKPKSSMDAIQAYVDAWQFAEAIKVNEYKNKALSMSVQLDFSDSSEKVFSAYLENGSLVLVDQQNMLEYVFSKSASAQLTQFQ
jgi:hypothetical protein